MRRQYRLMRFGLQVFSILTMILITISLVYIVAETIRLRSDLLQPEERLAPKIGRYQGEDLPVPPDMVYEGIFNLHFPHNECEPQTFEIPKFHITAPFCALDDVGDSPTIYVYGESSIILGEEMVFTSYLDDALEDATIINFGVPGIDSMMQKARIRSTIEEFGAPDLAIIYSGHNDYSYARIDMFDHFTGMFNIIPGFVTRGSGRGREEFNFLLHRENLPRIVLMIERMGLIDIDSRKFSGINEGTAEQYNANLESSLEYLQDMEIETIVLTNIVNTDIMPVGDTEKIRDMYHEAGTLTYPKGHLLRREAIDHDLFTFPSRAHTDINDHIRTLDMDGVSIIDLEAELLADGFRFSYENFITSAHLRDRGHARVGQIIAEHLTRGEQDGEE